MTGHQINSLVGDLVAMAQAMEQLPKVERELDQVRMELGTKVDTIQRLELKLLDRANEIDVLHASIRELEVAKDSAETMFLEADDRTTRALEFVKTMFGSAGSLIQALEPPKPEPVSTEAPSLAVGQADERPLSFDALGQSESDPTAQSTASEPVTSVSNADTAHGSQVNASIESTQQPDELYVGKYYYDYTTYISYQDWINGGGTATAYHWRPSF